MQISGMITGTLGYSLKREFLANAIALRDVETFSYEIYSIDFSGFSANTIQNQIKNQFSQVYSGDVNVTVFDTQNTYAFPSDSLRAAKYGVTVEIRKPVTNLSSMMPELASGYYAGLDANFFTGYGQYLIDFKESFTLSTNANGNKEYNHDISFGLKTGFSNGSTVSGRKSFAQAIASGIFSQDKNTNFGYATLVGQANSLADSAITKNYFTESYDLLKNSYGFGRKRELLPIDGSGFTVNISNNISMGSDGLSEATEKASFQGKNDFTSAKNGMESYLSSSFTRCATLFSSQIYNNGVMFQDPQYSGVVLDYTNINSAPLKTIKIYDAKSMTASYEVTYSNNPNLLHAAGAAILSDETMEVSIDAYDRVEMVYGIDFTADRAIVDSSTLVALIEDFQGSKAADFPTDYYSTNFPLIAAKYPQITSTKQALGWANIKSKVTSKYYYSNNPLYNIIMNGVIFPIFDYTITEKKPTDIVNEYKVVNRPTKTSVLSYGYQTQKGEVSVNIKAMIGKQRKAFAPDGIGSFGVLDSMVIPNTSITTLLNSVYKTAGQIFLNRFTTPVTALNWFISDSKFSLDSDGNLNADIVYTYTIKKRLIGDNP